VILSKGLAVIFYLLLVASLFHVLLVLVAALGRPYGLHASLPLVRLVVEAAFVGELVPVLPLEVVRDGLVEEVFVLGMGFFGFRVLCLEVLKPILRLYLLEVCLRRPV
jgi:hypothetical protein